jgi:hypothetical protein
VKFIVKYSGTNSSNIIDFLKNEGDFQGKTLFYLVLRMPKGPVDQQLISLNKYYVLKALIIRGDAVGYEGLKQDLNTDNFGIITKPLSPFVTKANGFSQVNKMYTQRLFTFLYPYANQDSRIMM